MANTISAKKAIKVTIKKTEVNKARKSRIKTYLKKVNEAVLGGDDTQIKEAFVKYESELMKGVKNNVCKKNTAARKLSRLSSNIKKAKENKIA